MTIFKPALTELGRATFEASIPAGNEQHVSRDQLNRERNQQELRQARRRESMDAQSRLLEMRVFFRHLEVKFGRQATAEDILGNWDMAQRCREHSVAIKKALAGHPPDDLFTMEEEDA
jgi:hypothetical protein